MWQNSTVFPLSVINYGSHLSLRRAIHNKEWKIDEHINYEWALCGEFDSSNFDVLSYESPQYRGVLQFSLVVILAHDGEKSSQIHYRPLNVKFTEENLYNL